MWQSTTQSRSEILTGAMAQEVTHVAMSGTLAAVAMDTGEVHLCDALQVCFCQHKVQKWQG